MYLSRRDRCPVGVGPRLGSITRAKEMGQNEMKQAGQDETGQSGMGKDRNKEQRTRDSCNKKETTTISQFQNAPSYRLKSSRCI